MHDDEALLPLLMCERGWPAQLSPLLFPPPPLYWWGGGEETVRVVKRCRGGRVCTVHRSNGSTQTHRRRGEGRRKGDGGRKGRGAKQGGRSVKQDNSLRREGEARREGGGSRTRRLSRGGTVKRQSHPTSQREGTEEGREMGVSPRPSARDYEGWRRRRKRARIGRTSRRRSGVEGTQR